MTKAKFFPIPIHAGVVYISTQFKYSPSYS